MNICQYLERTGQRPADLARLSGLPVSTIYRLRAEEIRSGRVLHIDGATLVKLVEGTNGQITSASVLGIGKRRRTKAA